MWINKLIITLVSTQSPLCTFLIRDLLLLLVNDYWLSHVKTKNFYFCFAQQAFTQHLNWLNKGTDINTYEGCSHKTHSMTSLGRNTEATNHSPMGTEGDISLIHKSEWTPPQRTPYTACASNVNMFISNKTHTILISSIFSNQWPPVSSAVTHHVQSVLNNTELIMSYNLWLKHYSLDVH